MPQLVDVATAEPPFAIAQEDAAAFARARFGGAMPHIERLMPLFANTGIRSRNICKPPSWYETDHGLGEKNEAYIEAATTLCAEAARTLLARRGLKPTDIDRVFFVNTTGLATPSIDARLINVLGLKRDVRRTPIWGLGCAGGVAGLATAARDLVGHPRERALVFAAEMCSLTFLADDFSKSNLVATALFADGAACALVSGDDTDDAGFPILGTRSMLFPDSLDIMGWSVVARGLQVVFDQRIPAIIRDYAASELTTLLEMRGLTLGDVTEFLYHPGGPKVLQAYADAYGISTDRFQWSKDVFRDYGNMSSVTVMYVLSRYIATHPPSPSASARQAPPASGLRRDAPTADKYGVVSALGPGFSSEAFLLGL